MILRFSWSLGNNGECENRPFSAVDYAALSARLEPLQRASLTLLACLSTLCLAKLPRCDVGKLAFMLERSLISDVGLLGLASLRTSLCS